METMTACTQLHSTLGDLKLTAQVSDACVVQPSRPFTLVITASNGDKVRRFVMGACLGDVSVLQAKSLLESCRLNDCLKCGKPTLHQHYCFTCASH